MYATNLDVCEREGEKFEKYKYCQTFAKIDKLKKIPSVLKRLPVHSTMTCVSVGVTKKIFRARCGKDRDGLTR